MPLLSLRKPICAVAAVLWLIVLPVRSEPVASCEAVSPAPNAETSVTCGKPGIDGVFEFARNVAQTVSLQFRNQDPNPVNVAPVTNAMIDFTVEGVFNITNFDASKCTLNGSTLTCNLGNLAVNETGETDVEVVGTDTGTFSWIIRAYHAAFNPCGADGVTETVTVNVTGDDPPPPPPPPITVENTATANSSNDPISTFTGEFYLDEPADLNLGGPLPLLFRRYYAAYIDHDQRLHSALGPNWAHVFDWSLIVLDETTLKAVSNRGRITTFTKDNATWTQADKQDRPYQLVADNDGFRLGNPRTGRVYAFDLDGLLTTITDGRGNTLTLAYNGDQLVQVSDGLGRVLSFGYQGDRLTEVSDGTRTERFGYNADDLLTSATNAEGETTTYAYTTSGAFIAQMTERTLPEGNRSSEQVYDDAGRVMLQRDGLGNPLMLAYDGDQTTLTDAFGQSATDVHSAEGRLTERTDRLGQIIRIGYDGNGRRTRLTDRLGDDTRFTFDPVSGLATSITEADGTTTTYTYTTRTLDGLTFYDLSQTTYADGTTQSVTHDASGNPLSRTDEQGHAWQYAYNARGQVLIATNPEGGTTTYSYHGDGTLASEQDPAGNTTTYAYDALWRLVTLGQPDGTTQRFTYDEADRLLSQTDEEGRQYTFTYDRNGNLTRWTDASGSSLTLAYDARDDVVEAVDRTGGTSRRTYDALGRLTTTTNPEGHTTTYAYDGLDRLISLTDAGGQTASFAYDAEGILTAISTPQGETTNFTSDQMGRLTRMTSPAARQVAHSYDPRGRVTTSTDPLGQSTLFNYDARGVPTAMTVPGGAAATYAQDGLGLLTATTDPNNAASTFDRDAQGRLTTMSDPLGRETTLGYDARNRVVQTTLPGGLGTRNATYDASDRVTGEMYSDGTSLNYSYDANGRLTAATDVALTRDDEGRITATNGLTVGRDANGRMTSLALPGGGVQYRYDGRGLVREIEDAGGVIQFTYDPNGRLTTLTRPNGTTTTYTYDADGLLLGLEESGPNEAALAATTLVRDARGQVTEATRAVPLAPTFEAADQSFGFDAASQTEAFTHDALGRVADDGTRSYQWDLASRLTSYTDGETTVQFSYDAFGNRTTREHGGEIRTYVWNYALGLPAVSVEQADGTDRYAYVHTPGGRLLYRIDLQNGSRHFYHYDEMGHTLFLTDEAGAVVAAYAYSPYGEILAETGDVDNAFTYQGAHGVMREHGTGLHYARARYYDATTGRFLSRDPIRSFDPRNASPYAYAQGNPQRFIDPNGLEPTPTDNSNEYVDIGGTDYIAAGGILVAEASIGTAGLVTYICAFAPESVYAASALTSAPVVLGLGLGVAIGLNAGNVLGIEEIKDQRRATRREGVGVRRAISQRARERQARERARLQARKAQLDEAARQRRAALLKNPPERFVCDFDFRGAGSAILFGQIFLENRQDAKAILDNVRSELVRIATHPNAPGYIDQDAALGVAFTLIEQVRPCSPAPRVSTQRATPLKFKDAATDDKDSATDQSDPVTHIR